MPKVLIEDPDLRERVHEYLAMQNVPVTDGTEVLLLIPGKELKQPRPCACGCGQITSGGKFVPGHDAMLKSSLYAIIRGKLDKAPDLHRTKGLMDRPLDEWTAEEATQILREYNWPDPAPPKPKKVKPPKAENGETNSDGQPVKKTRKKKAAPVAEAPVEEQV